MRIFEGAIRIVNSVLEWTGMRTAPDVAPAYKARLYYDRAEDKLFLSKNGGAYSEIGTFADVGITSSADELNLLDGSVAGTAVASKAAVLGTNKNLDTLVLPVSGLKIGSGAGTAVTPTAAELNVLAGQTGVPVQCAEVTYTETAVAGTYTGSVSLPAGATLVDIIVHAVALWANTAATMKVGDAADDDGYFTGIDLKATDLLAGESLCISGGAGTTGGKEGADISGSQVNRRYLSTARVISGIITTTGATGTTGRTRMTVLWTNPTASAATKV